MHYLRKIFQHKHS